MKTKLISLTLLPIVLFACVSALQAAEVNVTAPGSPMLRFALGKLEAALRRQAGTMKWNMNQSPDQGAQIVVAVDPTLLTDIGADGFRRISTRQGLRITGGDERGAMYGVLDVAAIRARMTPSPTLECELTDIEAWVAYGSYFAEKLRAGVALATARAKNDAKQQAAAISALERALAHWKRLAELGGKFNRLPVPSNSKEPFSWTSLTPAVEKDIEISRQTLGERTAPKP